MSSELHRNTAKKLRTRIDLKKKEKEKKNRLDYTTQLQLFVLETYAPFRELIPQG